MEIKKITEGLEDFITTDKISTVINGGNDWPPKNEPCYGVVLPKEES